MIEFQQLYGGGSVEITSKYEKVVHDGPHYSSPKLNMPGMGKLSPLSRSSTPTRDNNFKLKLSPVTSKAHLQTKESVSSIATFCDDKVTEVVGGVLSKFSTPR